MQATIDRDLILCVLGTIHAILEDSPVAPANIAWVAPLVVGKGSLTTPEEYASDMAGPMHRLCRLEAFGKMLVNAAYPDRNGPWRALGGACMMLSAARSVDCGKTKQTFDHGAWYAGLGPCTSVRKVKDAGNLDWCGVFACTGTRTAWKNQLVNPTIFYGRIEKAPWEVESDDWRHVTHEVDPTELYEEDLTAFLDWAEDLAKDTIDAIIDEMIREHCKD